MNILESVVGAGNGAAVQQLAARFGLRPEQATAAITALMPALAAGLQRNMATEGGAAKLESALATGHHQAYVEQPETLTSPATAADGNAILGHIFGSKEVSRQVAAGASQKTGIDPAILKQLLPIVAAAAMGALAKRSSGTATGTGTTPGAEPPSGSGIAAMLQPLLDRDGDGSVIDDVTGMLGGFLGRQR